MASSSGAGGCLSRRAATTSSVGDASVSLDVSVLSAAPISPSAHLRCTLRAISSLEFLLGALFCRSWLEMIDVGRASLVACRLMAVVSEHFRVSLQPGDLRTLKANVRKLHQSLRLVLATASLIRIDRRSATVARAGFGISLMTCVDPRSWANAAAMSSGCPSGCVSISSLVLPDALVVVLRSCDGMLSPFRHGVQCQIARARA